MKKLKNLTEKMLAKDDLLTIKGGYPYFNGYRCLGNNQCYATITMCYNLCGGPLQAACQWERYCS